MIYRITHQTTYEYAEPVTLSHHVLRLKPRELPYQSCQAHELKIDPAPAVHCSHTDYFGNPLTFLTIEGSHPQFQVASTTLVHLSPQQTVAPAITPPWEEACDLFTGDSQVVALDAYDYVFDSPYVKYSNELFDYATLSFAPERPILEAVLDLTKRIYSDFEFDPSATTVATPLSEVLDLRRGVCQDFAHLEIGCLRSLGLPARYVSGYLETTPPPGKLKLAGADVSHAWLSFFCPGHGWIDVDPTNNLLPSDRHITLAWGRDYGDISPLRGVLLGGGTHSLKVAVDVNRCEEGGEQGSILLQTDSA